MSVTLTYVLKEHYFVLTNFIEPVIFLYNFQLDICSVRLQTFLTVQMNYWKH